MLFPANTGSVDQSRYELHAGRPHRHLGKTRNYKDTMAVTKQIPSIKHWGGVKNVQQRLGGSATIAKNREAVAYSLLTIANTKLTDVMEWDDMGSIKVNERTDKDGNTTRTLDIELYDKVGVLRILAKASGLLDTADESDKPSVIGINVKAPEIIDVEPSNEP